MGFDYVQPVSMVGRLITYVTSSEVERERSREFFLKEIKIYSMKFYYVYILKCSDDSLYVGITSDIERRVMEHNGGKYPEAYTHSRRPVELVFCQEFMDPNQAIEFEKKIKKWSRAKKQALINDNFGELQRLSECRNSSHYKLRDKKESED